MKEAYEKLEMVTMIFSGEDVITSSDDEGPIISGDD